MKLTVPVPPSTNHIYAHTGRVYKSSQAKAYAWEIANAVWKQKARYEAFEGPLMVELDLFVKSLGAVDVDNSCKCLIDSLAAACGFNDKNIIDLRVRKHLVGSRKDVRCEVTLSQHEGETE